MTVCVNYWYDMKFDDRYCASRLGDRLERVLRRAEGGGEEEESESESESESVSEEEESDDGDDGGRER